MNLEPTMFVPGSFALVHLCSTSGHSFPPDTNFLKMPVCFVAQQGMILLCLTILEMEVGLCATSSARHRERKGSRTSQTSHLSHLSQFAVPLVATDGV